MQTTASLNTEPQFGIITSVLGRIREAWSPAGLLHLASVTAKCICKWQNFITHGADASNWMASLGNIVLFPRWELGAAWSMLRNEDISRSLFSSWRDIEPVLSVIITDKWISNLVERQFFGCRTNTATAWQCRASLKPHYIVRVFPRFHKSKCFFNNTARPRHAPLLSERALIFATMPDAHQFTWKLNSELGASLNCIQLIRSCLCRARRQWWIYLIRCGRAYRIYQRLYEWLSARLW